MKGRLIEELVHETVFEEERSRGDAYPQNFQSFLQRHLVMEVRQEVNAFFGHLETLEAKYPGLDYNHPIHRIRLSRWQWHDRLFKAFDKLRLTEAEISALTKWEGTKWARDRFEREQNTRIPDSTVDEIGRREDLPNPRRPRVSLPLSSQSREEAHSVEELQAIMGLVNGGDVMEEDDSDEEMDDTVVPTMLDQLEEQAAAWRRSGGQAFDVEEWEQWFKNLVDNNELASIVMTVLQRPSDLENFPAAGVFPRSMLAVARRGQWEEIPEFLHDVLRHALENDDSQDDGDDDGEDDQGGQSIPMPIPPAGDASRGATGEWGAYRRPFSHLRLPRPTAPSGV